MAGREIKYAGYSTIELLWARIRLRYDHKLDKVIAKDPSIEVTDKNKLAVRISNASGNTLKLKQTAGEQGLYVSGVATSVGHKLTFGADQDYVYDGSEDVTVPVYTGEYE